MWNLKRNWNFFSNSIAHRAPFFFFFPHHELIIMLKLFNVFHFILAVIATSFEVYHYSIELSTKPCPPNFSLDKLSPSSLFQSLPKYFFYQLRRSFFRITSFHLLLNTLIAIFQIINFWLSLRFNFEGIGKY